MIGQALSSAEFGGPKDDEASEFPISAGEGISKKIMEANKDIGNINNNMGRTDPLPHRTYDADRRRRKIEKEVLNSFYLETIAATLGNSKYRGFWKEHWTTQKQAVIIAALRTSLELCKKAPELGTLLKKKQLHLSKSRGIVGTEEPSSDVLHTISEPTDIQLPASSALKTATSTTNAAEIRCMFEDPGYPLPIDEAHAKPKNLNGKIDLINEQASSNFSKSTHLPFGIDRLLFNNQLANDFPFLKSVDGAFGINLGTRDYATMNSDSEIGSTTERCANFAIDQPAAHQALPKPSKSSQLPFGIERLLN